MAVEQRCIVISVVCFISLVYRVYGMRLVGSPLSVCHEMSDYTCNCVKITILFLQSMCMSYVHVHT